MKKPFFAVFICLALFMGGCGQSPTGLKTGDPAPDFTLTDLEGKSWTLSQLKGQVVFINFWATWCPPCLKELPAMQNLYGALPKDKFKMLAVLNNDSPETAQFIVTQKNLEMPVLNDSENKAGIKYRLTGLPETFIVDKQGILRHKFIGPEQWDDPRFIKLLTGYINQP